jgi:ribosomal protein L18E
VWNFTIWLLLLPRAQVLGAGELSKALTIEAAKFSSSASEKITAAGATASPVAQRKKWTRKAHEKVRSGWVL